MEKYRKQDIIHTRIYTYKSITNNVYFILWIPFNRKQWKGNYKKK